MKTTKFKPSEVGPIPVEWEVKRFDDTFEHVSSKPFQIQSSEYQEGGKFQVVDQGQMEIVGYTDDGKKLFHVPREGVVIFGDHTRIVKFRESDFVVGADGTQLLVGKECCTRFLFYVLQQLDIPNLGYSRHFKYVKEGRYAIPPTLPEQKAIAEALSDMDALLAAMTTLIEKKRAIKQGAMQELLGMRHDEFGMGNEPIRRLAGFSGAWVEKRLGACGKSIRGVGYKPNQAYHEAGVGRTMLLRSNNVRDNVLNFEDVVYVADECVSEEQRMLCGDILICSANGSRNLVGKSARLNDDRAVTFGAFMMVFRPNETISSDLVCYLLQSDSYRQQIDDILTGSAINNLNAKDVLGLTFYVPPTLAEQKAIAAVLSDMDAEIAALEAKWAKYERIRQGMMQELLTGKTRLV